MREVIKDLLVEESYIRSQLSRGIPVKHASKKRDSIYRATIKRKFGSKRMSQVLTGNDLSQFDHEVGIKLI